MEPYDEDKQSLLGAKCSTVRRRVHDSHRLPVSYLLRLVVLLAAIFGCSSPRGNAESTAGGAPGRGIYVPRQWAADRRVSGHRVHVVERRIACSSCHELSATSVGRVSPTRCATCHEAQSHIEHAGQQAEQRLGPQARADCADCHAFTSDADPEAPDGGPPSEDDGGVLASFGPKDCARCHQQAQGRTPAIVVHATAECVSCHRPHEDAKPVSAACANCHQTIHTTHAALGKSPNGVCTTCHAHQHAPAADALASCLDCHAKTQPIVPASAVFAGGHQRCVSCHAPHQFKNSQVVPCRSCHAAVEVLAQAKVPVHGVCTSCHTPHDVRAAPAAACAKCHWDVHSDHPERAASSGCSTCHDAHPTGEQKHVIARACSSCHESAKTDRGFHGGTACQKCHAPHHFKLELAQRGLCQSCHQNELKLTALRSGHAACQSCHAGLPHQPAAPGAAVCDSCHTKQRATVVTGHESCTGCHEPHGGGQAKECKSCHVREFESANAGHRKCIDCHQPHTGSSQPLKCVGCHARESASPHGGLASGCLSCHRPHDSKGVASPLPTCTSCHALAELPGLHQKTSKHQGCKTCHAGHGQVPDLERLVCLTCHSDRSTHFAGARCANCHLFQSSHPLKAD